MCSNWGLVVRIVTLHPGPTIEKGERRSGGGGREGSRTWSEGSVSDENTEIAAVLGCLDVEPVNFLKRGGREEQEAQEEGGGRHQPESQGPTPGVPKTCLADPALWVQQSAASFHALFVLCWSLFTGFYLVPSPARHHAITVVIVNHQDRASFALAGWLGEGERRGLCAGGRPTFLVARAWRQSSSIASAARRWRAIKTSCWRSASRCHIAKRSRNSPRQSRAVS